MHACRGYDPLDYLEHCSIGFIERPGTQFEVAVHAEHESGRVIAADRDASQPMPMQVGRQRTQFGVCPGAARRPEFITRTAAGKRTSHRTNHSNTR